jgi:thiol-disulfide isomerase/thioredoxin
VDKKRRRSLILVGSAVTAAAAGIALQVLTRSQSADAAAIANLWALPLQDLEGKPQPLTRWKGKILVVNFWATWCEPCKEEVPALVRTQKKYDANNVQIVGISLDSAAKVQAFAKKFKIQYPLVIGSLDSIEITRKLGNKAAGLPYTLVLDTHSVVKARHLGGISEALLEQVIRPLISEARQAGA